MNKQPVIIVDADAIVSQAFIDDSNHEKTMQLGKKLHAHGARLLFPSTTIVEAVTTLQRKLSNPQLAESTLALLTNPSIITEVVDQDILREAKKLFDPQGSKKNTFFDCIVATLAKTQNADAIFSYDKWYKKLGFTLVSELF
jgi:predicted nucleic acid-binding protein